MITHSPFELIIAPAEFEPIALPGQELRVPLEEVIGVVTSGQKVMMPDADMHGASCLVPIESTSPALHRVAEFHRKLVGNNEWGSASAPVRGSSLAFMMFAAGLEAPLATGGFREPANFTHQYRFGSTRRVAAQTAMGQPYALMRDGHAVLGSIGCGTVGESDRVLTIGGKDDRLMLGSLRHIANAIGATSSAQPIPKRQNHALCDSCGEKSGLSGASLVQLPLSNR